MSGQVDLFGDPIVVEQAEEQVEPDVEAPAESDARAVDESSLAFAQEDAIQLSFLDEWWKEHWQGMPEFVQEDLEPFKTIYVHVETLEDLRAFADLVKQPITMKTKSVWYPESTVVRSRLDKRYVQASSTPDEKKKTRYPVYVISKGRWESRMTVKALDRMAMDYKVVVEPQEFDKYASVIDASKILVLPFSNLGQGSIPARNWVWEHALSLGAKRHWILDDNISGFYRLHRNLKLPVTSGVLFRCAEDFVDRYENVAISGFQYWMFAPHRTKKPPFVINTRIYSCILIQNDIPYRWRGRYNEDTDLSLRALKDGWCTMLFYAFIADKMTTMLMKGGNTDELYAGTNQGPKEQDGRWKMAESLRQQHPDVVRITWKWGRWQHHVDYSAFARNKLRRRDDVVIPEGVDNYGMELQCDEPKVDA